MIQPPTSTPPPTTLQVVAAALFDASGRVLITQRPAGKPQAGRWEFPGGKIAALETPAQALQRELREELGIDVAPEEARFVMHVRHAYADREVELSFFLIARFCGTPVALDGQSMAWVAPGELNLWDVLEADAPFVQWLEAR